jgi:hypothetical protein
MHVYINLRYSILPSVSISDIGMYSVPAQFD